MSEPIDTAKQIARDMHPLGRARPEVANAFVDAANLCCQKFLDDHSHTERSPLIHGPCDLCIKEIALTIQRGTITLNDLLRATASIKNDEVMITHPMTNDKGEQGTTTTTFRSWIAALRLATRKPGD